MYIGLDIGGTKTAVLLTTDTFDPLIQTQRPTDKANLLASIIQIIEDTVREANQDLSQLQGIGLGIPGIVDFETGISKIAVNLDIFEPIPLAKQLSSKIGIPVLMENDVRLAAVGLQHKHQLNNLIYLNVGTGVAAGIIINGRLHRGATNGAGEVGHIPLPATGQILEQSIAGPGIMRQAKESVGKEIKHPGELYERMVNGEPNAQRLVQTVSQQLCQTILWLMMMFDSEALFLGGGVTHIGDDFLNPILASLTEARSHSKLVDMMVPDHKIRLVERDFNAGLWGAAAFARQAAQGKA